MIELIAGVTIVEILTVLREIESLCDIELFKEIASLIPEDEENKAGFGPFTLPKEAAWMEQVFAQYHDPYYKVGPGIGMELHEVDVRVAKGLFIVATKADLSWKEQATRIEHICLYWSIMRSAGHYLYARNYKNKEGI